MSITLTYHSVSPLRRNVVSRVGFFDKWPLILIDVRTNEGIVGMSYLEPYLAHSARYIIPAIQDLFATRVGKTLRPLDDFFAGRKSLNLIGYEGVAMIANAGLDMAVWDALAKAAEAPLCNLLGGSVGPVPSYNSNGLWLSDPASLASESADLIRGRLRGTEAPVGSRQTSTRSGSHTTSKGSLWR